MRVWSSFLTLTCSAGLCACGKGAPAEPMPVVETAGAPSDPSSPPACNGSLPVMKVHDTTLGVDLDPDWSCYDGPSMPALSEGRSLVFHVDTVPPMHKDIVPPSWFQGIQVDLFFGPSTLGAPAVTRTLDGSDYFINFDAPAGTAMVSAHLHGVTREAPLVSNPELREYGFPIPAGNEPIEGSIIITDMLALAVRLSLDNGEPPDASHAFILAYARDCRGRDVSGARFELIDGQTNTAVSEGSGPGVPHSAYFYFALPDPQCTFTDNAQAIWMMSSAPVNATDDKTTHAYRLRLSGRRRASDVEPVILGEQEVELFTNTISMVRLYRSF